MSRKRYLTNDISGDSRVNQLGIQYGDFAAMLYTWLIPHADDAGHIYGTAEEIMFRVVPGRRDKSVGDIEHALRGMQDLGLIQWDGQRGVTFPAASFYKHQSYIGKRNRRDPVPRAPGNGYRRNEQTSPENAGEHRESADDPVSSSILSSTEDILLDNIAREESGLERTITNLGLGGDEEAAAMVRDCIAEYPHRKHPSEANLCRTHPSNKSRWATLSPVDRARAYLLWTQRSEQWLENEKSRRPEAGHGAPGGRVDVATWNTHDDPQRRARVERTYKRLGIGRGDRPFQVISAEEVAG